MLHLQQLRGDIRQVTKILFSGLYHTADAVYSTVSGEVAAEVDAAVELFSRRARGNIGFEVEGTCQASGSGSAHQSQL